ncbi:MAG: ArsR/SmtB family transcription factor [Vicinamibacterales bacterium]
MKEATALFRVLGDEVRLRLLRVVAHDRFNVTELTAILGIAQSGVSRHLGLLKDAGLVVEDRDGAFTYYGLASGVRAGAAPLWPLLEAQFALAASTMDVKADEARLQEVLRLRRENFDRHASPDTRDGRQLVPGRSWAAWSRALGLLLPPLEVADVGCGDGYLTIEVARWAKHVTGIDRSPGVLARARALAERRRAHNITWSEGELECLPLDDASMDLVLLSQALHHAAEPAVALAEAVRVLRPGGRLLLLDLRAHEQDWVRDKLGDRWLGFADDQLTRYLQAAGLTGVTTATGARATGDAFTVVVAAATKPEHRARRPARSPRSTRGTPAAVTSPARDQKVTT